MDTWIHGMTSKMKSKKKYHFTFQFAGISDISQSPNEKVFRIKSLLVFNIIKILPLSFQ